MGSSQVPYVTIVHMERRGENWVGHIRIRKKWHLFSKVAFCSGPYSPNQILEYLLNYKEAYMLAEQIRTDLYYKKEPDSV